MELQALVAADESSSRGDLERNLRRNGIYGPTEENEPGNEQEAIEDKVLEVFDELEARSIAAGRAYPFVVNVGSGVLQRRDEPAVYAPYVFCLCLSYWIPQDVPDQPRRMFENLCCLAARHFIGGDVARFAAPRAAVPAGYAGVIQRLPAEFDQAVGRICELIGEGSGYEAQPTLHSQDDKLDVVAWRHFPDLRPGKLVVFGQCASGGDWKTKILELNPDFFCEDWMERVPASEMLKAFFLPHRVERNDWMRVNRRAGVVFERCRLAYWVDTPLRDVALDDIATWAIAQLTERQEDVAA